MSAAPKDVETPPAARDAFADGEIVEGKYRIEKTLAEGGVGVVVAARHVALNQQVAIKYLKQKSRANVSLVQRFEREARLTAQIRSEHVVRVIDVGTTGASGPYIVMELLTGKDLGAVLEAGPPPIVRAVDWLLQACDALAETHALHIVHRDIKPENLFLADRPGKAPILKVIDFGISKLPPTADDNGKWARETGLQERFGTPLYMSPEQLRSTARVDLRSDIWALGVVLFELVTGAGPFEGEDMPRLCTSILASEPRKLSALRPTAPAGLEEVIAKCLEKAPERRFRNVAELAQALAPFGPPDADERVRHIRETVRQSGASIRPPTPATVWSVQPLPTLEPPVLVAAEPPPVVIAHARVTARTRVLMASALALTAILVLVLIATPRPSPVRTTASRSAAEPTSSIASPPAQPVSSSASLSTAATASPDELSTAVSSADAPQRSRSSPAQPSHASSAATHTRAPVKRPAASPRDAFGGRQ